jgi:LytS/YehU family sensor histidine kinase
VKRTGATLAAVVASLWGLLYVFTQTLPRPPLSPGLTVLAGVALSMAAILGYPSPLRGPRQPRPSRSAGRIGDRDSEVRTIQLVERTAPYLRRGLTNETATRTAELLRPILDGDAVAITDTTRILAFVGPGADHHRAGDRIVTQATTRALKSGRTTVIRTRRSIGCHVDDCALQSAVVAPLRVANRVVGTLNVYRTDDAPPRRTVIDGMTAILSLHLELAELDRRAQLAADARLDALRAQINPHFLFNTLNTIASKARTEPEEARQLLLRLSDFFRYSIRQDGHFADFAQEYFFVRTYVTLEQARFGERLSVRYDLDPQVLGVQVPVLVIQPLVENAIKHGLACKAEGGTVTLRARVDPLERAVDIQVRDNGVGMNDEAVAALLASTSNGQKPPGGGIGLGNIHDRLTALFADRCRLDVRSKPGAGTVVDLRLPLR